jgi:hypothetical protein
MHCASVVSVLSSNGHVNHRCKHGWYSRLCVQSNDDCFAGRRCRVSVRCFIICRSACCRSANNPGLWVIVKTRLSFDIDQPRSTLKHNTIDSVELGMALIAGFWYLCC